MDPTTVLLLTRDPALVDAVRRVAVAAGAVLEVAADRRSGLHRLVLRGPDTGLAGGDALPGPADGDVLVALDGDAAAAPGALRLPSEEAVLVEAVADAVLAAADPAPVVAVVGGCGGAGASTTAVALALAAARAGRSPVLVDLDPRGAGLSLLLAADDVPGLRWGDLDAVRGRVAPHLLEAGLPRVDGVTLLAGGPPGVAAERPPPRAAVEGLLPSLRRCGGVVLADLPRSDDAARAAVLAGAACVLLVLPARVAAVAAAARQLRSLEGVVGDLRLAVRSVAGGLPAEAVADALDLPLCVRLPDDPGVARAVDRGEVPGRAPRGSLAGAVTELLASLPLPATPRSRAA